jgi:DNA-binding transcriptional MerR regulator
MLIGELSKRSGFSRDTIRYYEKLGLIAMSLDRRADNGYKNYPLEILERLHHIHRLKECGFTLMEIRQLLVNDGSSPVCGNLPAQLAEKISKIDEKMAVLLEYKQSLLKIQLLCNGGCNTNQGIPDCIPPSTGWEK